MTFSINRIYFLSLTAIVAFSASSVAAAPPVLSFKGTSLEISAVTPGGRVALLAVVHEPKEYAPRIRVLAESLEDGDRDGKILYEVSTGIADPSVWVVADESSGGLVIQSPRGFVPVRNLPGSALRSSEALALSGDYFEILYFRPQVGAWRLTVVDSGSRDTDRTPDGSASIRFGDFTALGAGPPTPGHYRPGDIAVAIDPIDLIVSILGGGR